MLTDTFDRHLYTNDCYDRLEEVHETYIEREVIDPDKTLDYIIKHYNIEVN